MPIENFTPRGDRKAIAPKPATVFDHRKIFCFYQPKVLVIDDEPHPLLGSIRDWLEDQYNLKPMFEVIPEAASFREIESRLSANDFVMLDHRVKNNFVGFTSGAQIGIAIKESKIEMPIAYYTGYEGDLKKPKEEPFVKKLKSFNEVTYYRKAELTADNVRLVELCLAIATTVPFMTPREKEVIEALEGAQIEDVKQFRYRVENYDRRKPRQTLRCFNDMGVEAVEIPTRYLDKIELSRHDVDVWLKVVDLDGGQVLSYLSRADFGLNDLSKDILTMLDEEE
jgi:hypothetical protein